MKKLFWTAAVPVIMLGGVSAAAQEPSYEVMGLTITPHQVGVLGSVLRTGDIQERSATATLMLEGMPASPHQVAVLTPRPTTTEQQVARQSWESVRR